ncbi:MAG: replication-associated recombination protein A [Candidatus Omnitrophica bacterium]|nr:replication-associated recombination protein A [Candidatus Omnitrophota bacterium]
MSRKNSEEPGLFEEPLSERSDNELQHTEHAPLASRMRPCTLDEFTGQEHILGPGKLLRRTIEADRISSLIFYGPPGSGKTTLAQIISKMTKSRFSSVNAVTSNVAELRAIVDAAKKIRKINNQRTILFIDEIHRFNKAQQDVLMPEVENGVIVLIGATTHNPSFSIVGPLLSRSLVFELRPHEEKDITKIIQNALQDNERGLGKLNVELDPKAIKFLAAVASGDARRALNALEVGVLTTPPAPDGKIHFDVKVAQESAQKRIIYYDKDEDYHYDTASAFIKSMRGSDPDAAVYWLAKMLYAGEDPRFIARRIVILASEDIGNADPQALVVAASALQAIEFVGMPEARIILAQAVTYMATAPKSNAAYMAIEEATEDVKNETSQEVPDHLRGTSYPGAKKLGHGEGYKYPHQYADHYVEQIYVPAAKKYYRPADAGYEKTILERMKKLKEKN